MRNISKVLYLLFTCFFVVNFLSSQTVVTSTGYLSDFEDDFERDSCWVLNAGPNGGKCANKWYWGKPGANGDEYGLFVSNDNGASPTYKNVGVSVVAYRKMRLDAGLYELSFDWQAGGRSTDGLYVCWIPGSDTKTIERLASITTSNMQEWIPTYGLYFGTDSLRRGQRTWNVISDTIRSDGQQDYYLVFVWNNGVLDAYQPAVSIDNLLIMEYGRCSRPSQLRAATKGDGVLLTWNGNADAYDVRCVNNLTGQKLEFLDVTTTSKEISGLPEGMCTYYVRSKCDGVVGAWSSISKFLFYPAVRCIDYLSLSNTNCFNGTTKDPRERAGVVDFGYQASESRHTLHWDPYECDPRTKGGLKTVPDGEIASVRLGNWKVGGEAESVEYNYYVDTLTSAILELNYAVVLEDPDHDSLSQPRFTLEILDQRENPIDEFGCGEAYFSAGFNTSIKDGWHQMDNGWWKDWTKVSVNLSKFHGQSLVIRLTTYDCTQTGHYGYAYFTLGCSDGKIKGLTCGDADSTIFKGPDGFKYRWYLPDRPEEIVCDSQYFSRPATDTLTYYLDVIQPTNTNCYYTLIASMVGRWPRAKVDYTHEVKSCRNIVTFDNQSYVKRINQLTKDSLSTVEKCESFFWDFGDGKTSTSESPTHTYPDQGGVYTVRLSAGIADGKCMDDTVFTIVLPEVGEMIDTLHAVVCEGSYYEFNGNNYSEGGYYSDTVSTDYGCDSIVVLDLVVAYPFDTIVYDTICSDESYIFNGSEITETGTYRFVGKTLHGCDSIVDLNIVVNQALYVNFDSLVTVCADENSFNVGYDIISGKILSYTAQIVSDANSYDETEVLRPIDSQLVIPMPEDIVPGIYTLNVKFGDESCGGGKDGEMIPLMVLYSKEVLVQRWNDVLAVKNSDYNGGNYEFTSFQWYKNGTPIEGAISSILYEEDGLDLDAEYAVLLTREGSDVQLMSCVIDLFDYSQVEEDKKVVFSVSNNESSIANVCASSSARLRVWTSSGLLYKEFDIENGMNTIYLEKGFYIFDFISESNQRDIQQIVIY